ncbi:MAG: hypothetical protein Ct9H90mP9_3520 [Pseudomonadota bacterium]|nr:MAG: hypothetical protein Ct9H90mP9_3520 [Pseudomonadota bacterium]
MVDVGGVLARKSSLGKELEEEVLFFVALSCLFDIFNLSTYVHYFEQIKPSIKSLFQDSI